MTKHCSAAGERLLADTLAPAEAEADRHFGDGPVAAWRPPGRSAGRGPSRRIVLALATAALVASGAAAVAHWTPTVPAVASERAPSPDGDTGPSLAPQSVEPVPHATSEAVAPLPPATTTATATLAITRHGRRWHIAAAGASRLLAAQTFAQLTGTPLRGSVDVLAESRPLDLHWQGHDPARAWQALLGSEVSYALQCDARRCQAWIVDHGTAKPFQPARAAAITLAARPADATAAGAAVPVPMQSTLATPIAAPQADSPDPHVASHHD